VGKRVVRQAAASGYAERREVVFASFEQFVRAEYPLGLGLEPEVLRKLLGDDPTLLQAYDAAIQGSDTEADDEANG